MKLKSYLLVVLVAFFSLGIFSINIANAAGIYKISCKNDAYGMQLGSDYTDIAYVYNAAYEYDTLNLLARQYLIHGIAGAYVGNDCIYSGAGDTNGTAVVASDVARLAVNAIVGAVSNRIDMAYAARNSSASGTGLTFTSQSDGVAMSANKLVGGISFWADYGNSDFENSQAFSGVRIDSMKFDGSASSYSIGVDKAFGNALVGLLVSNLDADLKTTFNDGTYKQSVNSYGLYLAYRTRIIHIDLGMGQGDSTIDTTRRDLGSDGIITGKTTADIEYSNFRVSANFTSGKFSIVPSVSYRRLSMDIAAFTDDRPDDVAAIVTGGADSDRLFSNGNDTLTVTDDNIAARTVESETMDVGFKLSANLGKLVPYANISYASEDTTKASYKVEAGTDGNDSEAASTNYSSSLHFGAGINFAIGSHISGGIRVGNIHGRDDWEEDYFAGSLRLGF